LDVPLNGRHEPPHTAEKRMSNTETLNGNKSGDHEGIVIKKCKSGAAWAVRNEAGVLFDIFTDLDHAVEAAKRLLENPHFRPNDLLTAP